MADLRVEDAELTTISQRILASVSGIRLMTTLRNAAGGGLGSPDVAATLCETSNEQFARAEVVADSLSDAGAFPTATAGELAHADARLARVF